MDSDDLIHYARLLQTDYAELCFEAIFEALDKDPRRVAPLLPVFDCETDSSLKTAIAVCIVRAVPYKPAEAWLRTQDNWTERDFEDARRESGSTLSMEELKGLPLNTR